MVRSNGFWSFIHFSSLPLSLSLSISIPKMSSRSFPVISLVFSTSEGENKWHCCYQMCAKHRKSGRDANCTSCVNVHILSQKVAKYYIQKQEEAGFLQPKFAIRKVGPKMMNIEGKNFKGKKDHKGVYCNVFFHGFSKPQMIRLGKLGETLQQPDQVMDVSAIQFMGISSSSSSFESASEWKTLCFSSCVFFWTHVWCHFISRRIEACKKNRV